MADNYLITGYWGEPHVTSENDRGINAAMFGEGRFVLPTGSEFNASFIGSNTIRLYNGKLVDNGAAAGIPIGQYVDLTISNAGQGKKRNDLIVFQYEQDATSLVESGTFVVVQGAETTGTPQDPELTQGNILAVNTKFDQMPLYRVTVSGTTIAAPVPVFEMYKPGRPLELLWENSNPSAEFAGSKIITVPLYQYDGIEIVYIAEYADFEVKSSGFIPYKLNSYFSLDAVIGETTATFGVSRRRGQFTAEHSIQFSACNKWLFSGSSLSTDNTRCIPYRVYGVRAIH